MTAREQFEEVIQKDIRAALEFQKILDHNGIVNNPIGAVARLQLGRAYALSGDELKASSVFEDFLALWKDAPRSKAG